MKARKGNKEYTVSEENKENFIKRGFDIFDDKGKKIADGTGKNVSIEAYNKIQGENAKLKSELKKLKEEKEGEKA